MLKLSGSGILALLPRSLHFILLMLISLTLWHSAASAQIRRGQSTAKIGLVRTFVSGVKYELEETASSTTASNSDAMEGNELFLEYVFFSRIGLELATGLTEMVRNYDLLKTDGTKISTVEESARTTLLGLNFYFSEHGSPGVKFFFGLGTGVVSVSHKFSGDPLGNQSSSQSVPVNVLRLGLDWITDKAGIRAHVSSQTGEAADTETITGYKQTLNYSATVVGIGVFAFF